MTDHVGALIDRVGAWIDQRADIGIPDAKSWFVEFAAVRVENASIGPVRVRIGVDAESIALLKMLIVVDGR